MGSLEQRLLLLLDGATVGEPRLHQNRAPEVALPYKLEASSVVVRLPQVLLLEEPKDSERCVKLDLNKSYALQAGERNVQKQVLAVGSVP